ncbi:zinc finger CCCH-type with G patch domain-containing protein isoform X2 [Zerene cesonia]|uniref:zinc finger CCCH-type with G patch domain-containing protein isoform X2 n=1 Tax=Zerene cesonia TaxID=33412 RepID=UPI0018E526B4|nr:zinc finger CCCH-type with G patch domain-containing protein isoform X2 [Zerene cesonia]
MDNLSDSIIQYKNQLLIVKQSLETNKNPEERNSLLELEAELQQLIDLTEESLNAQCQQEAEEDSLQLQNDDSQNELDSEYALFMQEMAQSGAYEKDKCQETLEKSTENSQNEDSDIEDELASLLGMKCAVYHQHSWGGQPSLHNAMVSAVVPRQDEDRFNDLQVRVLFTHPTHTEMLPCPFFLNGECKFDDEKCRYSHGALVQLSELKEAIEPKYDTLKAGSRILLKLKAPDDEDVSIAKKSTEKYHLWHRAVVTSVDLENRLCVAKLEQGVKTGEKRKSAVEEYHVHFEELFPLNNDDDSSDSDDSISDTEYPEMKVARPDMDQALILDKSLQNNAPAMGEWEKHTRGIGSKLMLAMGYVPGAGLGAAGAGRVQPVEARVLPRGSSLDHCLALSQRAGTQDPMKVEQRLKRLQKKEEERNKRSYEREKERERRNVFNFLNKTLGDSAEKSEPTPATSIDLKQSSSKDLNIEQFKIEEDSRKIENEIIKLRNTLSRYPAGTNGNRNVGNQITEKNKELAALKQKGQQIAREQKLRKDKQKLTMF